MGLSFTLSWIFSLSLQAEANAGKTDAHFQSWKSQLWLLAKEEKISKQTFDKALYNIQPNYKLPRVNTHAKWERIFLKKIKRNKNWGQGTQKNELPPSCSRPRQKEFLFPTLYFPKKHFQSLVNRGKAIKQKYVSTFSKIEKEFEIDIDVVLAIWGRETAYGKAKNQFNGIRTWVSLAYAGPPEKRVEHRQDLIAALKFIDKGHINLKNYKTSFAGATGYPQFTPRVFEKYAIDFDQDGRKNIWTSIPDAIASTANYLKGIGWQTNQRWGYEVILPKGFDCANEGPNGRRTIQEWIKLGVRLNDNNLTNRTSFPKPNLKAQLMAPAGTHGPTFLVLDNFEVFRRYNKADLYALFVGHLSDRLSCNEKRQRCGFNKRWPQKDKFGFARKRICEMQIHLQTIGVSSEIPDGLFGGKTRNGIGAYEKSKGITTTCFPSKKLLNMLRTDRNN